jgi:hypothetical protein
LVGKVNSGAGWLIGGSLPPKALAAGAKFNQLMNAKQLANNMVKKWRREVIVLTRITT